MHVQNVLRRVTGHAIVVFTDTELGLLRPLATSLRRGDSSWWRLVCALAEGTDNFKYGGPGALTLEQIDEFASLLNLACQGHPDWKPLADLHHQLVALANQIRNGEAA